MSVQNDADIWIALRDEIRTWSMAAGYGGTVYLSERPTDETIAQFAFQIVPGGDSAMHPRSGVGLLEATVQVTVWWRNLLDPTNQATERIAGSRGIESAIQGLRTLLIQSTLGGRLTIPLTWRSGGVVEPVDDLVGWVRGTETFLCAFEIDWSV